ncbi:MAG: CAP domain-containing protein [Paracoccaceae bacterium]
MTRATALEHHMLDLINEFRARNGRDPLTMERNLNKAADGHSDWMTDVRTLSHTGQGGSTAFQRMREAGFDDRSPWKMAENVGVRTLSPGQSNEALARAMLDDLIASPGHRANLLLPDVTHVGIGFAEGRFPGDDARAMYVTQNFGATAGAVDEDHRGTGRGETLRGGAHDDVFAALGGNDVVHGGDGTDTAVIRDRHTDIGVRVLTDGGIEVTSADGRDRFHDVERFQFVDGGKTLSARELREMAEGGGGRGETIRGSSADDALKGGGRDDKIVGRGGDDRIAAGGGDDVVRAGGGDDVVRAGGGDDRANGGGGEDKLRGQGGDDRLKGQGGDDNLSGGGGADRLMGGAGDDVLRGGGGADTFVFDGGEDLIRDFRAGRETVRLDDDLAGGEVEALLAALDIERDIAPLRNGQSHVERRGGERIEIEKTGKGYEVDFGHGDELTLNGRLDAFVFLDDLVVG